MTLLSCHVDNFGKLSNYDLMFYKDITCFEEANGWGKSTFSVFLKAMLYGLEEENNPHSDRTRYKPWNGGTFGGSIVFSHEGVSYQQETQFGDTASEDVTTVTNLATNQKTTAFDQGIGDVIWKVNKDSFEKTAFLSFQGNNLYNELIAGKLIDRDDETAHRSEADRALSLLKKSMKTIQSNPALRKTSGLIGKEDRILAACKREREESEAALQSFTKEQQRLLQYSEKAEEVEKQWEENQHKMELASLRDQYQIYLDLEQDEDRLRQERTFEYGYLSPPPSLSQLEDWDALCNSLIHWEAQKKQRCLTKNEQSTLSRYNNMDMPSPSYIQTLQAQIYKATDETPEKLAKIQSEIQVLKGKIQSQYAGRQVNLNFINKGIDEYPRLQNEELELHEAIEREKENIKEESYPVFPKVLLLFAAMCLMLGSSTLALSLFVYFPTTMINIVGLSISLFFYFFPVVIFVRLYFFNKNTLNNNNLSREQQEAIEKLEKDLGNTINEKEKYERYAARLGGGKHNVVPLFYELQKVNDINEEIIEKELQRGKIEKSIQSQRKDIDDEILKYFKPPYSSDYQVDLQKIIQLSKDYTLLQEKRQLWEDAIDTIDSLQAQWRIAIANYLPLLDLFPTDALGKVKIDLSMLKKLEEDLATCMDKQQMFRVNHDMAQFYGLDEDIPSAQQLRTENERLQKERTSLQRNMTSLQQNVDELQRKMDKLPSLSSRIAHCEETIVQLKEEYRLLQSTHDFVKKASENIAVKYTDSMVRAFDTYLGYMDELEHIDGASYHINSNLEVELHQNGQNYPSHLLSQGTQDLLQLCMRFALIHSIYQNVPPPLLILDDPFINFDDKKINYARKLLNNISSNHQVIYFSCHSSRALERTAPIS